MLKCYDCAVSEFVPVLLFAWPSWLRAQAASAVPQKVILDTDIGDDIDDAFALAFALRSPELQILQVNADFGDTPLRARLLERFLKSVGREDIPVAVGVQTAAPSNFTQRGYAERETGDQAAKRDAIQTTLELIRRYPGEITLIGIGPICERWRDDRSGSCDFSQA